VDAEIVGVGRHCGRFLGCGFGLRRFVWRVACGGGSGSEEGEESEGREGSLLYAVFSFNISLHDECSLMHALVFSFTTNCLLNGLVHRGGSRCGRQCKAAKLTDLFDK
jgi:hypothetical protein